MVDEAGSTESGWTNKIDQVGTINQADAITINQSSTPPARPRLRPFRALGRPNPDFLGRKEQVEEIRIKLGLGGPVAVPASSEEGDRSESDPGDGAGKSGKVVHVRSSGEGWGQTSLLRELAFTDLTPAYPHGVIQLRAAHLRFEDISQQLFERTHHWDGDARPYFLSENQVQLALEDLSAVVVLDALELRPDQIQRVLDLAPHCAFVIGTTAVEPDEVLVGSLGATFGQELFLRSANPDNRELSDDDSECVTRIVDALHGRPASLIGLGQRVGARETDAPLELSRAAELVEKHRDAWPYLELSEDAGPKHEARVHLVQQLASISATLPAEFVQHLSQKVLQESADWLWESGLASKETLYTVDARGTSQGEGEFGVRIDPAVRDHIEQSRDQKRELTRLQQAMIRDVDEWTTVASSSLSSEQAPILVPFVAEVLGHAVASREEDLQKVAHQVANRLSPILDISLWPGLAELFFEKGVEVAADLGPDEQREAARWLKQHQQATRPGGQGVVGLIASLAALGAGVWAYLRFWRRGGDDSRSPDNSNKDAPPSAWLVSVVALLTLASIGAFTIWAVATVVDRLIDNDVTFVHVNISGGPGDRGPSTVRFTFDETWDEIDGEVEFRKCGDRDDPQVLKAGDDFPVEFTHSDFGKCEITIRDTNGLLSSDELGSSVGSFAEGEYASAAVQTADSQVQLIVEDNPALVAQSLWWDGFSGVTVTRVSKIKEERLLEFRLSNGTPPDVFGDAGLGTVAYNCPDKNKDREAQLSPRKATVQTETIARSGSCDLRLLSPDRGLEIGWQVVGTTCTGGGKTFPLKLDECNPSTATPPGRIVIEVDLQPQTQSTVGIRSHVASVPIWLATGDLEFQFSCIEPLGDEVRTATIEPLDEDTVSEPLTVGSMCTLDVGDGKPLAEFRVRGREDNRFIVDAGPTEVVVDVIPSSAILRLTHDGNDGAPDVSGSISCALPKRSLLPAAVSIGVGGVASQTLPVGVTCDVELDPRTGWMQTIDGVDFANVTLLESTTLSVASSRATPVSISISTAGLADNTEPVSVAVTCTLPKMPASVTVAGNPLDYPPVKFVGVTHLGSIPQGSKCTLSPTFGSTEITWSVDGQTIARGTSHSVFVTGDREQIISATITRPPPPAPPTSSSQIIAIGPIDAPAIPITYTCDVERSASVSVSRPLPLTGFVVGQTCSVEVSEVDGWTIGHRLSGDASAELLTDTTVVSVGADKSLVLELRRHVDVALRVRTDSTTSDLSPHSISLVCADDTSQRPAIEPLLHQDLPAGEVLAGTYCLISIAELGSTSARINGQPVSSDQPTQIYIPDVPRHIVNVHLNERGITIRTPVCGDVQVFGTGMEDRSTGIFALGELDRSKIVKATLVWAGSPDGTAGTDSTASMLNLGGIDIVGQHNGIHSFSVAQQWHQWSSDVTTLVRDHSGDQLALQEWSLADDSRDDRTGASLYILLDRGSCESHTDFNPEGTTEVDAIQGVLGSDDPRTRTASLQWEFTPAARKRTATIHLSFGGVDQTQCRNHTLTFSVAPATDVVVARPFSPVELNCADADAKVCDSLTSTLDHEWSVLRCRISIPAGAGSIDVQLESLSDPTTLGLSGVLAGRGAVVIE
ncbi:MAG: hypothetical protein ACI8TP_001621 [Acidimicrobiales bacterium]|jgi:hypothetical protein